MTRLRVWQGLQRCLAIWSHGGPGQAACQAMPAMLQDQWLCSYTMHTVTPSQHGAFSHVGSNPTGVASTRSPTLPGQAQAQQQVRFISRSSFRFTDDFDRHHRIGTAIHARLLRVVLPDGSTTIMPRRDALKAAAELKLDLVEYKTPHAGDGDPPLAKIIDYQHIKEARRQALLAHLHDNRQPVRASVSGVLKANQPPTASHQAMQYPLRQPPQHQQPVSLPSSHTAQPNTAQESSSSSAQGLNAARPQRKRGRDDHASTEHEQHSSKKVRVKEVFFSPKIAQHDIQVRLKRVRKWLSSGLSVSLSQEVDTGEPKAAERALDSYIQQLADVGAPKTGKKTVRASMVSIVLQPGSQHAQDMAGSGSRRK